MHQTLFVMSSNLLQQRIARSAAAWLFLTVLIVSNTQSTHADSYNELEPNDTFAAGQLLITGDGTLTVAGFREANGGLTYNDFFRFTASAGDIISISVLPDSFDGDSVLALFNPAGLELANNNDCDDSLGFDSCLINFTLTDTGLYGVGVRGFGDSTFNYTFGVTGLTPSAPVPEPASFVLLVTGVGAVAVKFRKGMRHAK